MIFFVNIKKLIKNIDQKYHSYYDIYVLKLDKCKEVNEEHNWNIPTILVTLLVLKLDIFKEFNEKYKENILLNLNWDLKLNKKV